MEIKKAEFVVSNPVVQTCPKDTKPEFAFIGRSNVGKSSLINMLCGRKGLAKTSATPGKTLLINHFIVNNEWYIVDLPGYGYAKQSKSVRKKLEQMIASYILQRKQLVNVFVLIDIRHCVHQGRQARACQGKAERRKLHVEIRRHLGDPASLFYHFRREKDRP